MSQSTSSDHSHSTIKKVILLLVVVIGLMLVFAFAIWPRYRSSRVPDFLKAAATNNYSAFIQLAATFYGDDPRKATNDFETYLARHDAEYARIPQILRDPSEAPASSYDAENMPMIDMMNVRYGLGLALHHKAEHLAKQSRWGEAAHTYLDVIRVGLKLGQGTLIYFLVGTAIEQTALNPLEKLAPNLSEPELAEISTELHKLNGSRMPFPEILLRERYFMEVNSPNLIKFALERFSPSTRKTVADARERYLNTAAYMEVVAVSVSITGFVKATNRMPASLADLVPRYFPMVPLDPYIERPLLYSPGTTNYLVYSVGPNKQDDGGKRDDVASEHQDTLGMKIMTDALSRAIQE